MAGRQLRSIVCTEPQVSAGYVADICIFISDNLLVKYLILLNEPVGVIKTPPSDQEVTQCRMASDSSANRPSGETPLMKSSFRINESVGGAEWAR